MARRLSAILAADMVGFSRLMEADEVGTLRRQKAHRAELINPLFEKFHGRIVKEMGDGILVEFLSVVEAMQCALTIQQDMVADGALLTSEFKILMKQAGSDTPYTHMLKPSKPETCRFDRDNTILYDDSSDEESDVWFDIQRVETLGITILSTGYPIIYITDY